MEIEQVVPEGRQTVQSYWPGGFTVNGVRHRGGLIVLPSQVEPLDAGAPDDLSADRLDLLRPLAGDGTVELLIIGMGERLQAVPADAADVAARLGPGRRGHGHARPPAAPTMCLSPKAAASPRRSSRSSDPPGRQPPWPWPSDALRKCRRRSATARPRAAAPPPATRDWPCWPCSRFASGSARGRWSCSRTGSACRRCPASDWPCRSA